MQASIYQFINLNWLCLGHPFQQLNIEESGTETTDKHLTQTRFFLGTLWIPWCDIRLTFIKSNFSVEHSISFPQNVTNWCDHTSSQHRNKKEGLNGSQTTFNHFLLVKKIKEQTKNWHTHTQIFSGHYIKASKHLLSEWCLAWVFDVWLLLHTSSHWKPVGFVHCSHCSEGAGNDLPPTVHKTQPLKILIKHERFTAARNVLKFHWSLKENIVTKLPTCSRWIFDNVPGNWYIKW